MAKHIWSDKSPSTCYNYPMATDIIIWTEHSQKRLGERKIDKKAVIETILNPQKTHFEQGRTKYYRKMGRQTISVIVKKNEAGENVIISCWIRPPNPGTKDYKKYQRYLEARNASFFKKIWLAILTQLGL